MNRILFLKLLLLTLVASATEASFAISSYDFYDVNNEQVATIELSTLPATHNEITMLTFTEYGDSLLGLGLEYTGDFDFTGSPLIDDGNGGLTTLSNTTSTIGDSTPPTSTNPIFPIDIPPSIFDLFFDGSFSNKPDPTVFVNPPSSDSIFLSNRVFGNFLNYVEVIGEWRAVPEPSSAMLAWVGFLFFGLRKQARRN